MFNKKIILSVLMIAFIGVGAAGTWANIQATGSTSTVAVTPGTVGLAVNNGGLSFSVANILPGESSVASFIATNPGTRNGYLFVSAPTISGETADFLAHTTYYASLDGITYQQIDPTTGFDAGQVLGNSGTKTVYLKVTLDSLATDNTGTQATLQYVLKMNQIDSYTNA